MSGVKNSKRCDGCGGSSRVLSLLVVISYRSVRTSVPAVHLCEDCIVGGADLAKIALEIEGGPPSLAESFSETGIRPRRNRALFVLADCIKAVYLRWRGIRQAPDSETFALAKAGFNG